MDIVVCGVIKENDTYAPVMCNALTGECFFEDPVMGFERLIAEVANDDPVEVDVEDMISDINSGAYGPCIGVIADGDTVLILRSETKAVRKRADLADDAILDEFEIDIYGDYDSEEE